MVAMLSKSYRYAEHPTGGMELYYKLFELMVYSGLLYHVWLWSSAITSSSGVYHPGGLAHYLPLSLMFDPVIPYVNAGIISGMLLLGFFRIMPKYTLSTALLLIHIQYVARFTLGKLPHETVFLGMALLGFVLAVWLVPRNRDRVRFVFVFLIFFMGLAYMMSAAAKIIGTYLVSPDTFWANGQHLWLWINSRQVSSMSDSGIYTLGFLSSQALNSWFVATAMLSYGLLVEAFGFLLWFDRTRWLIALLLIGLHLGIGMVMGLYFFFFIAQLAYVGFRWDLPIDGFIRSRHWIPQSWL